MASRVRTPSVWLLSRVVTGDNGERYTQNVSVFASSAAEAKALVASEFTRLSRFTGKPEAPYRLEPDWNVEQVRLDGAKLITVALTS